MAHISNENQKGRQTMAMYDWNRNEKKDMADNFIEHQIYKDVTGQNEESSYTPSSRNGMFTFGVIISVIAGLVLQSVLYTTLGIDVDDVPVLVIIILWGGILSDCSCCSR